MGIIPRPYLVINGKRVAGGDTSTPEAITLAGLKLNLGSRDSAADQATWPTATVELLASGDFGPAQRPLGLRAEIFVTDGNDTQRVFFGYVDKADVAADGAVVNGRRLDFRLTLNLISRPAAVNNIRFNNAAANNRPAETISSRLAWINRAFMEQTLTLLEYFPDKPLFDAASGAAGFWNHYVQPKDYRLQPAVPAWTELALCAGEFVEYLPHPNRLSARGRTSISTSFVRLGWRANVVDLVAAANAGGRLIHGDTVPMSDSSYSDAGTIQFVEVSAKIAYNGLNNDLEDIQWSTIVNDEQLRTAYISTLGLDVRGGRAGQETANAFAKLYEDASEPYHPPVEQSWDEGWPDWTEAIRWLSTDSYKFGPAYVSGSVFNRLRPGQSFHARGSMTAVWEPSGPTRQDRRWRTVLGLTPIKNTLDASLRVRDINPSATAQPAASITYGNAPGNPALTTFPGIEVQRLAAALAARTSSAFDYDDFAPTLTLDELATAARGI